MFTVINQITSLRFEGEKPDENEEYPKLINNAAYDRCQKLADEYKDRIIFGGTGNKETRRFAPTKIYPVKIDENIVKRELFCPLLPIVPFKDEKIDNLMEIIADREHPLAMYVFTQDMKWVKKVMSTQQYGGGCINEVYITQDFNGDDGVHEPDYLFVGPSIDRIQEADDDVVYKIYAMFS